MDTSDDPVSIIAIIGAAISESSAHKSRGSARRKAKRAASVGPEGTPPAEADIATFDKEKRRKRLAGSVLTRDWLGPTLSQPGLLGQATA